MTGKPGAPALRGGKSHINIRGAAYALAGGSVVGFFGGGCELSVPLQWYRPYMGDVLPHDTCWQPVFVAFRGAR